MENLISPSLRLCSTLQPIEATFEMGWLYLENKDENLLRFLVTIIEGMAYRSKFFFPIGEEGKTNFMLGPTQTGMGVGP